MESALRTTATPALSFPLAAGQPLLAAAAHYELLHIARGPRADAAFGSPFDDVHRHHDAKRRRFVAGYLGLESESGDETISVTSHGRRVARVSAVDEHSFVIERVSAPSWPDGGFAVLATPLGTVEYRAEGTYVTGADAAVYLVHGPAPEKVLARIEQLEARAAVFGLPAPTRVTAIPR